LVCDFEELYRYLLDDYLIGYCQKLTPEDFCAKTEIFNGKKGKRIYLDATRNRELINKLYEYFKLVVDVPRIRMGRRQEIESLINEEAFLLAQYLRGEKAQWIPRTAELR
jgi:hypothetical protein